MEPRGAKKGKAGGAGGAGDAPWRGNAMGERNIAKWVGADNADLHERRKKEDRRMCCDRTERIGKWWNGGGRRPTNGKRGGMIREKTSPPIDAHRGFERRKWKISRRIR